MNDGVSVALFLDGYPAPIRDSAGQLREIVRRAVPEASERLRPGWRLIGYDVPLGKVSRYFAYVAPELEHLHLGFEYSAAMADPERRLEGGNLNLRQVRFITFHRGQAIPVEPLIELVREAARGPLDSGRARCLDARRGARPQTQAPGG